MTIGIMEPSNRTSPLALTAHSSPISTPSGIADTAAGVDKRSGGSLVLAQGGELSAARRGRPTVNDVAIRTLDVVFAGSLLLLLAPLLLLSALAVRLDSPGPIFFRSRRVGFRGKPLHMLKFRKMVDGASGVPLTTDDDSRFTRAGVLLARFKIDEVPQLWHVLRGDMSLVGPRPEDPLFVEQHREQFSPILRVKPGVTGFSQIAFAEESSILDDDDPLAHYLDRLLPQKMSLDMLYAERRSFWLNVRILFWTVAAVLARRQVAVHRESGKMNLRRR